MGTSCASTNLVFVYFGLQIKYHQLSSNNSLHTSCIHKGFHAGKWPDLMTSGNPVLICIIGTHWKTTGATSTLGCPWNNTGWWQHQVESQWHSSVNLHNWNTHWKTNGRSLKAHWSHTCYQQLFPQWHSSEPWGLNLRHTGLPLNHHWITTGSEIYQAHLPGDPFISMV